MMPIYDNNDAITTMVSIRVECFFYRSEQGKKPKFRYDFKSPNPKFWIWILKKTSPTNLFLRVLALIPTYDNFDFFLMPIAQLLQ